jgi:hypothetical protein
VKGLFVFMFHFFRGVAVGLAVVGGILFVLVTYVAKP